MVTFCNVRLEELRSCRYHLSVSWPSITLKLVHDRLRAFFVLQCCSEAFVFAMQTKRTSESNEADC